MRHAKPADFENAAPINDTPDLPASHEPVTRVPVNLLGKVLDHGRASIHAAHLLAVKIARFDFDRGALNQHDVKMRYGVGWRAFREGLALLKRTKVLDRRQLNHRTYAVERLADRHHRYVECPEELLCERSTLVAFVLAANLSPVPRRPAEIAERIGITSPSTIRTLVRDAIAGGYVAHLAGSTAIWLARVGQSFPVMTFVRERNGAKNGAAKKGTAKNGATQRDSKKGTETARKTKKAESVESCHRSRPNGREPVDSIPEKNFSAQCIVLQDWRCARFFADEWEHQFSGEINEQGWPIRWREMLAKRGDAPAHLQTPQACRQALEISHELMETLGMEKGNLGRCMYALAYWVHQVHLRGKEIRSLALVVEPLARRARDGDDLWLYDAPATISAEDYEIALAFADEAATALENSGFSLNRKTLFSGLGLDELAALLNQCGRNVVVTALNHAMRNNITPPEGRSVAGWRWFDEIIGLIIKARCGRA